MKIVHVCVCGPFSDGWSYQDNLIPKYHSLSGNKVTIVTSKWSWGVKGELQFNNESNYVNNDGVKIIRLNSKLGTNVDSKFKIYADVYKTLKYEKPDMLFIHGCQFLDILQIVKYVKKTPNVKVIVDNHADFSNSATNFISKNLLHKIIWKYCAKKIEPYTSKFYGVLPARVDFLLNVYDLPKSKVELLVMGAEDEKVIEAQKEDIKSKIREKYGIKKNEFLIITGGKIDWAKKQTMLLMQAVKEIKNNNVKLIVFGSVTDDLKENITNLSDGTKIQYIGWIDSDEAYKYFSAADLVVFPGRHSVFWEQAVGIGKPCIFKHWEGTTHIDLGGNCKFLYNDSSEEIKDVISEIINNDDLYRGMKKVAIEKGIEVFSYSKIAQRSIDFKR